LRIELDAIVTAYSFALTDKELILGSEGVDLMTFVDRQDNRARKELNEGLQFSAIRSGRK
jgi:hypothetical protein